MNSRHGGRGCGRQQGRSLGADGHAHSDQEKSSVLACVPNTLGYVQTLQPWAPSVVPSGEQEREPPNPSAAGTTFVRGSLGSPGSNQ